MRMKIPSSMKYIGSEKKIRSDSKGYSISKENNRIIVNAQMKVIFEI